MMVRPKNTGEGFSQPRVDLFRSNNPDSQKYQLFIIISVKKPSCIPCEKRGSSAISVNNGISSDGLECA